MTPIPNNADTTTPIRIMFVDDEALTRAGIRVLLDAYAPRLVVVAEAHSAGDALPMLAQQRVDILLTDLRMQGNSHSGFDLIAAVRRQYPDLPVIIVTGHNDDATVLRAFKAGASGFVSKEGEPGEILRAIEAVYGGATYFPRHVQRLLDDDGRKPVLSKREQEVCDLIAIDMSSKEIARVLGIDYRTVDTHRSNIVAKLGKSGMELHRHCIDDLNLRLPVLARREAKVKLVAILTHHGMSHDVVGARLGMTVNEVAQLLANF